MSEFESLTGEPFEEPQPYFHVGQRVVCIDDSTNRLGGPKALEIGKVYTVCATFDEPLWAEPGWGVFLEGVRITNPVNGEEWPIDPRRFRAVDEGEAGSPAGTKVLAEVP